MIVQLHHPLGPEAGAKDSSCVLEILFHPLCRLRPGSDYFKVHRCEVISAARRTSKLFLL